MNSSTVILLEMYGGEVYGKMENAWEEFTFGSMTMK